MKNPNLLQKYINNLEKVVENEQNNIPTENITSVVSKVCRILTDKSIKSALTGGLSINLYTQTPRNAKDIDIVIILENASLENIISSFSTNFSNSEWYYDLEQIRISYNKNTLTDIQSPLLFPYILLHNSSGYRVDLFVAKQPYQIHAVTNKTLIEIDSETKIAIASLESIIISRFLSYSKSRNYKYFRLTKSFLYYLVRKNIIIDETYISETLKQSNNNLIFDEIMVDVKTINSLKRINNIL